MDPWIEEERFLQQRENRRNDRITRSLTGQLRPPDDFIIEMLKERYGKYAKFYRKVPILRSGKPCHRRRSRRSE